MSFLRVCIYIGPVSSKVTARQLTITDVTRITAEEGTHIPGGVIYRDDVVFDQDVGLVDTVCVSLQKHAHYVIKLIDTFQGTLRTSRFRTHMYTTLAQKVASGGTRFPGETYVGFVCVDEETSVSSQTKTVSETSLSSVSSASTSTASSSSTSTLSSSQTTSLTSSLSTSTSTGSSQSTSSTKAVESSSSVSSSSPSTSMGQSATSLSSASSLSTTSQTTVMLMSSSTSQSSVSSHSSSCTSVSSASSVSTSCSSVSSQTSLSSVSSLSSPSTSQGLSSESSSQMSEGLCSLFAARAWDEDENSYIDTPVLVSSLDGVDWEFECCLTWDNTLYEHQQFHTIFSSNIESGQNFFMEVDTGKVGGNDGAIRFQVGSVVEGRAQFEISGIEDLAEHHLKLTWVASTKTATLLIDNVAQDPKSLVTPVFPSGSETFRIGYRDSDVISEDAIWDGEFKDVKLTVGGVLQFHYELRASNTGSNIPDIGPQNNDGTARRFFFGADFAIPAHGAVDILDEFTTTEAAPLTDPRTCEPGPGTMDFSGSQASSDFSITGGKFRSDRSPDIDDNARWHITPSQTRTAGRRLEALITLTDADQSLMQIGWTTNTTDTGSAGDHLAGMIEFGNALPSFIAYRSWSTETGLGLTRIYRDVDRFELARYNDENVFVSVVLRATGFHVFHTYAGRLKHLGVFNEGTDTPLFPAAWFRQTEREIDYVRVRQSLWTPTPVCSDSFVRGDSATVGTTDDAGVEESGGGSLTWVEVPQGSGDAEILSNRVSNLATGASANVFVYVDSGQSDVLLEADLYPSDWAALLFRFVDANNYMAAIVDSAGDDFRLVKVVAGVSTTLDNLAIAGTTSPGELSRVTVLADGKGIQCHHESDIGTQSIGYRGTINELESSTKHGVYLDNEVGGVRSEASRFAIWKANVTNYT